MHPSTAAAAEVIKNRWLGFLIWQALTTTVLHFPLTVRYNPFPSLYFLLAFSLSHLSILLFSFSLFLLSSPSLSPRAASLPDLASGLLGALFRSLVGGFREPFWNVESRRRAKRAMEFGLFGGISAVAGFLGLVATCGSLKAWDGWRVVGVGIRGAFVGLAYAGYYLYRTRWVLRFPIVQRPLFFSFKIGIASSLMQAFKLSIPVFLPSTLLMMLLPTYMKTTSTFGQFIVDQISFLVGTAVVFSNWELSHSLLQIVHTRRCSFAPSQGSAAAETNPSETLLESVEQSSSRSLLKYLAYLDLCMVSENNVEPWRRAAFFEETGETYRRIIFSCLRPLEQLTSRLSQVLEGHAGDNPGLLSLQLPSLTDASCDMRLQEAFDDFQVCAWCARTAGALTSRSHVEDRFGVAQLTGCNAAVVSTLLSCLLAVEACMGKKTSLQSAHLIGAGSIRWATLAGGRRDGVGVTNTKKRNAGLHGKAYSMADVLKTSVYGIVSRFESDMLANVKASILEKNWIAEGKPLYGTREMLLEKLRLFLEFRA